MAQWTFIIGAYVLTAIGVAGVSLASWRTMRTAEREAEGLSIRA